MGRNGSRRVNKEPEVNLGLGQRSMAYLRREDNATSNPAIQLNTYKINLYEK
jgi:hypothetical protein